MARTPNPTQAQLVASLPAVAPNMDAILSELLARLRVDFPNAIAAVNDLKGWTGTPMAIEAPRTDDQYRLAPAVLADGYQQTILLANDLDLDANGIGTFGTSSTLQIFIVEGRYANDRDLLRAWAKVSAMLTVMKQYLVGPCGDTGVRMWHILTPQTVTGLPQEFASDYGGLMLTYRMEFAQQSSGWPASITGAL